MRIYNAARLKRDPLGTDCNAGPTTPSPDHFKKPPQSRGWLSSEGLPACIMGSWLALTYVNGPWARVEHNRIATQRELFWVLYLTSQLRLKARAWDENNPEQQAVNRVQDEGIKGKATDFAQDEGKDKGKGKATDYGLDEGKQERQAGAKATRDCLTKSNRLLYLCLQQALQTLFSN
ncbi:hypothetical protein VTK73DRAFT_5959 [Phialemonium thermophilum]|uniref:Uncharacterized protein n=1 Tax=Phialemonium thermophilum TaxID=223376 RepID=A0ABR3WL50_9PEZI